MRFNCFLIFVVTFAWEKRGFCYFGSNGNKSTPRVVYAIFPKYTFFFAKIKRIDKQNIVLQYGDLMLTVPLGLPLIMLFY